MEKEILSMPPGYQLYKERAVYLGTFLGGPLVAGYLFAENFKRLGEQAKARLAWLIAIVSTIAIIGLLFIIPDIEKVPSYLIPIVYAAIAEYLVRKYQGTSIHSHIEKGGQVYSAWRVVWIGLVGAAIVFGVIFLLIVLTNAALL